MPACFKLASKRLRYVPTGCQLKACWHDIVDDGIKVIILWMEAENMLAGQT